MNKCIELFLAFLKIGMFTFGGGYAMISIIENNCVEEKKWITHDEMMEVTVIAESTPGPIAINCATFVGYKIAGIFGAIAATLGVVLPSFLIIFLISSYLDNFLEIPVIANAFMGIKVGVGILIFSVGIKMVKKMPKKVLSQLIMACAFLLSGKVSSVALMLVAGVVSLMCFTIQKYKKEGKA